MPALTFGWVVAKLNNMSLAIGIIGLPNVGKSTLFSLLTQKAVDTSNYPFATIDPNVGVVAVPDERLGKLAALSKSSRTVPAVIEFVDIAGLVKGAHQGEGLGNKFLANIREVDAIAHVIRSFPEPGVAHVSGTINPVRDFEVINIELALADLSTVEKRLENVRGQAKTGDKKAAGQLTLLERLANALKAGQLARTLTYSAAEKAALKELNLLTLKPELFVINCSDAAAVKKPAVKGLPLNQTVWLPLKTEVELNQMPPAEATEYRQTLGLKESAVDRMIKKAYTLLNLITYFTTGPKETRAWTITKGTKAPQAAAKIHTDFQKKFIRAEVINWQTLLAVCSETTARERGLIRTEGKDYLVQDGDVIEFKI